jgi:hypothetical protein
LWFLLRNQLWLQLHLSSAQHCTKDSLFLDQTPNAPSTWFGFPCLVYRKWFLLSFHLQHKATIQLCISSRSWVTES